MSSKDTSDPACCLITGGAGFVGSRLRHVLQGRYRLVLVDDQSAGLPLPPERDGLSCHLADVRDLAAVTDVFARHRPGVVVHLAAIHHIPTCEADPYRATEVNVMGFQRILEACRANGCRKVVLASSGAVYDWVEGPLVETAPVAPRDVYACSKAANEHQLAAWCASTGGTGSIARMFNVIGPNDPNGHLIPDVLGRLEQAAGPVVELSLGNITTRRDFVDVDDMAAGLAAMVSSSALPPGRATAINLCGGADHTAAEIAGLLAAAMGLEARITSIPELRRSVDRPSQLGDPAKASALLGWRATRTLADSVQAIVREWQAGRGRPCRG